MDSAIDILKQTKIKAKHGEELRICYYKNMFLVQCIQYPIFNKIRWDNGSTEGSSRCRAIFIFIDWE